VNRRVILGVCSAWVLAGLVLAGQSALDVAMRGGKGTPLSVAFIQTLPWIPVTLAAIALTIRVPFSRARLAAPAAIHFGAAIVLSFVANVLTVLGYMASGGSFGSVGVILKQGALWGTLHFHIALLIYAAGVAMTQAVLFYRRTRAHELQVAKLEGQLAQGGPARNGLLACGHQVVLEGPGNAAPEICNPEATPATAAGSIRWPVARRSQDSNSISRHPQAIRPEVYSASGIAVVCIIRATAWNQPCEFPCPTELCRVAAVLRTGGTVPGGGKGTDSSLATPFEVLKTSRETTAWR